MRRLRWILIAAALLYGGAAAIVYSAQDAMVFHPPTRSLAGCDLPAGVVPWAYQGEQGLLAGQGGRKLILFFHGNAGDACNWRYLGVNHLNKLGYDVLALEYPGYGGDARTPSMRGIEGVVSAAAGWAEAEGYRHRVAMGYSLGTGAAAVFARDFGADKVVLFAPYDSIYNVAWSMGMVFPRALLKTDFDNVAALSNVETPVYIVHGSRDRVIPAHF
ncbi:MAG: alpha/beta fold hydrolase, partial [Rhodobacteraceae bacterium]|nr:alpha/beta fold hydrolase [Paracoccaceae bacterium]